LISGDSVFAKIEYNNQLAVVKYILESGKCDFERGDWERYYNEYRRVQKEAWKSYIENFGLDSNDYPLDTTLPSIDELDLEILRGPQNAVSHGSLSGQQLLEVHATTNPFSTSTDIEYTLGSTAQVELSLLNTLGQVAWHKPFGAVEDAAKHKVSIPGSDLQPGSYFLRVATLTGEVKTVKLIKE
jgi:hypothetical protein